ncbi:hypothetical protein KC19_10G026400 [Ceratodon purpureus]|uniref:Exostosin GT47 domain-containing protein n=2 Tax=Ceratodon purpureus TaxID=3225 RepID=A0A8T0GN02_CERPU|nr:hypothetical protein KC19_10G026400 [Ceratodon purpureus]KAG0558411.1 hypothetical protein KC19_10G026400 [Ceratodon purpureus]KAG0558412.1 hypothetical protein KC19_10G026400 [Ceratodon purpureus]KAG0558413.1 hypothetical protein KC19_10G026400 [Ceratodon purpureus]KAG0558414.1 hypothetical protein KC19_10G026400 [Ceratodon purpureus]
MWRSVPGRNGGSKIMAMPDPELDLDDVPTKSKPLRTLEEAKWIRKGYVLATLALLTLFLLSGFGFTHIGHGTTSLAAPTILSYLRTLNADLRTTRADYEEIYPEFESSVFTDFNPPAWNATTDGCNPNSAKLKVFMYDLPAQFHYGMLAEDEHLFDKTQTWPRNVTAMPHYPGGLYQQHSPEYWLISDVLTSDMPDRTSPCTAFRVRDWQVADVILVPYFASLSYNKYSRQIGTKRHSLDRNQELQAELLAFLKAQPAWTARREDHVVVIHHPNSMVAMRKEFRRVMFVVADFGRYGSEVANLMKDVVAPYKHVIPSFSEDTNAAASFNSRPTLLFFQGAIVRKEGGVIRQQLYNLLRREPDVVFATGATTSAGIRSATTGMRGSKFCLHLAGDTPSSNRLFDAVASHCVPLIISDEIELPFEDVLDYSQFCIFVNASDALRKGFVTNLLRTFPVEDWARMHARLREVSRHFEWQHPSEAGDAVHMTWEAIARKVPALTLSRHKRQRYARSQLADTPPAPNVAIL